MHGCGCGEACTRVLASVACREEKTGSSAEASERGRVASEPSAAHAAVRLPVRTRSWQYASPVISCWNSQRASGSSSLLPHPQQKAVMGREE